MKKSLLLGLLAGVGMLIINQVVSQLAGLIVPSYIIEMQNGQVYRPWTDPLMMLFFVYPFLLGVVLGWFWELAKKIIKGRSPAQKGFNFAVMYFVIASIPGMFITLSSFQVSYFAVLAWTVAGFLEVLFAGWFFAKLNS